MNSPSRKLFHGVIALMGFALISTASAQQAQQPVMTTTTTDQPAVKLSPEELDSLVAPIALYADQLLAQTLAASTYPLEIIQLQQWMDKNKNLTGQALAAAVAKQPWDPSVQGLVQYPDVVQRMAGNVQWTTDMGNAFLAQQSDVMDAVQRMRAKAQGTGNLQTTAQQVVQTETVSGGKQVIAIAPANPEVVYVPSYDPTVVYGAAPASYPYYPYTYPGYVPGTALAWGAGIALGAAVWGNWGGSWGNCNWNGGTVNINNNYNYNKNVNRGQAGQGGAWTHNPAHRGNAPYGDRNTAGKYGGRGPGGAGGAGGVGGAGRPGGPGGVGGVGGVGGAGKPGGPGGIGGAGKPGGPGGAGGIGGAGKPGGPGGAGGVGGAGKPGGPGGPGSVGGAGKPGGAAAARPSTGASKPAAKPGGSSANKVGGHQPSKGGGGNSAFHGGSGSSAKAASNRGGSSMSSGGQRGGGGAARGGGGGGGRGGGGGGRGGGGRR